MASKPQELGFEDRSVWVQSVFSYTTVFFRDFLDQPLCQKSEVQRAERLAQGHTVNSQQSSFSRIPEHCVF